MNELLMDKYARLIVKTGLNIQRQQILVINCPIECAAFARLVARQAYQEGAKDVVMNWKDELFTRLRYLSAPEEVFDEFPDWQKEFYLSYMRQGAAFLSIAASNPELLKDVNSERVTRAQKASNTALQEYREALMSNHNVWSVVSIPTASWAAKVFPDQPQDEAIESLWNAILKTVRVDAEDPVAAWEKHKQTLKQRMDFLNSKALKELHYHNSLGTDLRIELPKGHQWLGGSEYTPGGVEFIANMPTEEVFTLPLKTGVNGTAVSSKPLNYNGNLIENFSLTFEQGKIIAFKAEKGEQILKKLIDTDIGSHYLGEVALVPYHSPISNANILFYNTLFDENASCHLAIGKAYPVCLEHADHMGKEELEHAGVNDSLVHEDFMIGTSDLTIMGITESGEEIAVFRDGDFAM